MNKLTDTYGYCIIPKNSLLYRGHKVELFDNCMFFATKYFVAGNFNSTIQIWKTTNKIQVVLLIESITTRGRAISALPQLHKVLFQLDSEAFPLLGQY